MPRHRARCGADSDTRSAGTAESMANSRFAFVDGNKFRLKPEAAKAGIEPGGPAARISLHAGTGSGSYTATC